MGQHGPKTPPKIDFGSIWVPLDRRFCDSRRGEKQIFIKCVMLFCLAFWGLFWSVLGGFWLFLGRRFRLKLAPRWPQDEPRGEKSRCERKIEKMIEKKSCGVARGYAGVGLGGLYNQSIQMINMGILTLFSCLKGTVADIKYLGVCI